MPILGLAREEVKVGSDVVSLRDRPQPLAGLAEARAAGGVEAVSAQGLAIGGDRLVAAPGLFQGLTEAEQVIWRGGQRDGLPHGVDGPLGVLQLQ